MAPIIVVGITYILLWEGFPAYINPASSLKFKGKLIPPPKKKNLIADIWKIIFALI